MKRILILAAALLPALLATAQNPTAYFMDGATFRSQFNPAFAPQRGYLNLPAIGGIQVTVGGNVSLNSIVYPRNGKLVTLLDQSVPAAEALANLRTITSDWIPGSTSSGSANTPPTARTSGPST